MAPCPFSDCTYATDRKSDMTRHQRTHTGEKPYKCTTCEKSFTQSTTLKDHLNTHKKAKPHKCRWCSNCFSDRSSLYRHEKSHQGEVFMKCHYRDCISKHSRTDSLTYHFQTAHGIYSPAYIYNLSMLRFNHRRKLGDTEYTREETDSTQNSRFFCFVKDCPSHFGSEVEFADHVRRTHNLSRSQFNLKYFRFNVIPPGMVFQRTLPPIPTEATKAESTQGSSANRGVQVSQPEANKSQSAPVPRSAPKRSITYEEVLPKARQQPSYSAAYASHGYSVHGYGGAPIANHQAAYSSVVPGSNETTANQSSYHSKNMQSVPAVQFVSSGYSATPSSLLTPLPGYTPTVLPAYSEFPTVDPSTLRKSPSQVAASGLYDNAYTALPRSGGSSPSSGRRNSTSASSSRVSTPLYTHRPSRSDPQIPPMPAPNYYHISSSQSTGPYTTLAPTLPQPAMPYKAVPRDQKCISPKDMYLQDPYRKSTLRSTVAFYS